MKIKHNITRNWKILSGYITDVQWWEHKRWDCVEIYTSDWKFRISSCVGPRLYLNEMCIWWGDEYKDTDRVEYEYLSEEDAQKVLDYINEFSINDAGTFEEFELVEVSDTHDDWIKKVYLFTRKDWKHFTTSEEYLENYARGMGVSCCAWNNIRKIPKENMKGKEVTVIIDWKDYKAIIQ